MDCSFFVGDTPLLLPRISSETNVDKICPATHFTESKEKEIGRPRVIRESKEIILIKLSRVVKQDMRLNFVGRFMSAINSGDMNEIEDFSRTFIRPDAPLNIRFQNDEAFCIPKCLCGIGPRAHILYMLGCFVMFPDLVVRMGRTQLITSKCWRGTKIILPWQCLMTKTYHIPDAWWIPPDSAVEWLNTQHTAMDRLLHALDLQNNSNCLQYEDETGLTNIPNGTKQTNNKPRRCARGLHLSKVEQNNSPGELVPRNVARKIRDSAVLFSPTPQLWAHGTYVITLDEEYNVTSIVLSGTQERLVGTKELFF